MMENTSWFCINIFSRVRLATENIYIIYTYTVVQYQSKIILIKTQIQ